MTTFKGSKDHSEIVFNKFEPKLKTQFIRLVPSRTFKNLQAALRCEFYGVYE